MNYNVAKHAIVKVDTDVTTVDISTYELLQILDVSEDPIVTLSGSDMFVLDCDFGSRIHISEIVYHFKSTYVPAGTVTFYYKNEPFQEYTDLVAYTEGDNDGYRTTLSGSIDSGPFAPRYIKLVHDLTTVSGYVSGDLYGFETLNDDNIVDFGEDGTATESEFDVARGGLEQIQSVAIYNDGESMVDALVCLEPTFTDTDNIMAIGLSDEGPWYKALDSDSLVHDETNFDTGESYRLSTDGDAKIMTMYKDINSDYTFRYASGTYTTRLFQLTPYTQNRIILDVDDAQGGYLTYDPDHLVETIQVRSSKQKPRDYNIYRELYQFYDGSYRLAYRDRWTSTGAIKENHTWGFTLVDRYTQWHDYQITMDSSTERTAGFCYSWGTDYRADTYLRLFNNIDTTAKTYNLVSRGSGGYLYVNYVVHHEVLDATGGIWIYFYCQSYNSSDFVDQTGYYLAYFNANLTNKFKYFKDAKFAEDMDSDYSTGLLWYTYPTSQTIVAVNNEGETLYSIANEDTDYLGGLCVLSDGTVWYANDGDLIRLSSEGNQIDRINDMLEDLEVYDKLATDPDGDDAIWAIWGFNVYRIILDGENKGTYDMSFTIEGALHIWPVKGGCWVYQADISGAGFNRMQYISKENRRVDRDVKTHDANTTSSSDPSSSWFAPMNIYWNDDNYLEKMPLDIDTEWKNLEYSSVPLENYLLAEDHEYYQVRTQFNRETPQVMYDAPEGQGWVNDDDFEQPDGPPEKVQLWGRWSSDDYVYVEDGKLILKKGANAYIESWQRMIVSDNFNFNCYFSFDTYPVQTQTDVYIYAHSMDSGHSGDWWNATGTFYTNGDARIAIQHSDGGWTSNQYSSVDSTKTGLRLYRSDGRIYGNVWNGSSWLGTAYHNDYGNQGSHYYVSIRRPSSTGEQIAISSYYTSGGTVWYYTGSPRLRSIYTQESLELKEIYQKTSKDIYVRAQVALADEVSAQEEMDLRVKWRQPVP